MKSLRVMFICSIFDELVVVDEKVSFFYMGIVIKYCYLKVQKFKV